MLHTMTRSMAFSLCCFLLSCTGSLRPERPAADAGEVNRCAIATRCDEGVQVANASQPIDLLFMIDNSGSMEEEQDNLTANFGIVIDTLLQTPADFRIAVVSSEMIDPLHSGRFQAKQGNPRMLSRNTPNLKQVFTENAKLGTMGDGFEKGLAAVEAALSAPLINGESSGFLRPDAVLGVVYLSDEEDCSHEPNAIPEFDGDECVRNIGRMIPVQHYIDSLKRLKNTEAGKIFVAAITGPDLTPGVDRADCSQNTQCTSGRCAEGICCPGVPRLIDCRTSDDSANSPGTNCYGRKCLPTAPARNYAPRSCSCFNPGTGLTEPGTRYIDLVRALGQNGVYMPICAADWAKSLRDIADLAVDLVCKFPLSALKLNPNEKPSGSRDILVAVNHQELPPSSWRYNCPEEGENFRFGSISFDAASCPIPYARFQIGYDRGPTAGTAAPVACSSDSDGGAGRCPAGYRCGNCNYCEMAR